MREKLELRPPGIALTAEPAAVIQRMDRRAMTHCLLHFDPGFRLDFTLQFLSAQSDDQLRHLVRALCLVDRGKPRVPFMSKRHDDMGGATGTAASDG